MAYLYALLLPPRNQEDFFMFVNQIIDPEWGNYFSLTTWGYLALIVILLCVLLCTAFRTKNQSLSVRQLAFCAMAMALAIVTSNLKIWRMPMGGSVTLLSMLFISLIGYWYGLRTGILTAIAYGLLQLIIDPYIISLPQLFFDYIFAFGALGLSGLFTNTKHGLYKGYLASILGRFTFTFISGIAFFADSAASYHMSVPLYSFCYNGAYIFAEAAITFVILLLPPVKDACKRMKLLADAS